MTLSVKDKIELSRYRIEKAKRLLHDALSLFNAGSYESAVNRSYYAVLTASRSLLILRGIDPETHEGVKTMLSKEFIRTGLLPKEFGETFRSIQARRIDSDYGDYVEIGFDEASDSANRAQKFVEKAEEILNSFRPETPPPLAEEY
jgi:uncharacterized protein (UPF0332 family)